MLSVKTKAQGRNTRMSLQNPGRIAVIWQGSTAQAFTELETLNQEIEKTKTHAKAAGNQIRTTLNASLIFIRGVVDLTNLVVATTGEQSQMQFLTLISLGLSSALAVQTQIAVYSANPGTWPLALMLLAVVPVITGMIAFIRSENDKGQARLDNSRQEYMTRLEEF